MPSRVCLRKKLKRVKGNKRVYKEVVYQWPPFGTNFPKGDSILSNQEHIFKSPRQTGANLSLGIPGLLLD